MTKTRTKPNSTKSRSFGIKPFIENTKTAFPNMMRRVTQTARNWATSEKHSEKLKPYLVDPNTPYLGFDDTWPQPISVELPNVDWTSVTRGAGEDQYRFQCQIICRHTTREQDKCTAPIKCIYGAWTREDDGNIDGWQVFDSDGNDITGLFEIEWKPSLGLTGEIWITPAGTTTWESILEDDDEKISLLFHDKGNKPGSYYHPLLQKWIQLIGGKSICDDELPIGCEVCPASVALAFDDASTSDTIAPGGSITMYVTGGKAPFSWSTSDTGYSFGNATTTARNNTLTSAAGVCGVNYDPYATITVTDACGDSVNFVIRNTGGQWSLNDFGYGTNFVGACANCGNNCRTSDYGNKTLFEDQYRWRFTPINCVTGDPPCTFVWNNAGNPLPPCGSAVTCAPILWTGA